MKQKFLKLIADLRFAIINLLLISFCSIIGTVIEQDQPIEIYKKNYSLNNPVFGIITWDKIIFFGFDHIYKTWWFFGLIFLFGVSLITCTFLQQFPSLKIARRCQFFRNVKQFKSLTLLTILNNLTPSSIFFKIKDKDYTLFQQKNIYYCYKGLIGKIAPIIVHFSMILILIGTIKGAIYGFKSQEIIPKTEIRYVQNIFGNGKLTNIPNSSIRVNDFWITYSPEKTISQFYSDLSILNNYGLEVKRQTSFVNAPLIYNKVYYYQTDWNLIGLRVKTLNHRIIEYPLIQPMVQNSNKVWLSWISGNLNSGVILILDNIQGYSSIYDDHGLFIGNLELHEAKDNLFALEFLEILSSTGLQIKSDPGIFLIYSGSVLLMISTILSYITYSQIWIVQKYDAIFLGGSTSRAIFDFELEFFEFTK